jgi:NitT/TauT family transport system substrate-binding protein
MTSIRRKRHVGLAAIAVAMLILWSVLPARAADEVNVRFSWKLKGEYAAFYTALDRGFFAQRGLDVHLGEGAGAPAALGALLQGQEDIVVLPGIFAISAIQKGMPVKLIAMYQPKIPVVIIAHPGVKLASAKDMEGKLIATSVGETGTTYLSVLCKITGTDCDKIRRVQLDAQARVPAFMQQQVDLVSVYRNNDLPILEQTTNSTFPMLDLPAAGLGIPGLSLVTSDSLISQRPDVLRRFLAAVNEGIEAARQDPEAAADAMIRNWPGAPPRPIVVAQVKATNTSTALPAPGKPAGWVDPASIAFSIELLKTDEQIDQPKPASAFFDNALLPR